MNLFSAAERRKNKAHGASRGASWSKQPSRVAAKERLSTTSPLQSPFRGSESTSYPTKVPTCYSPASYLPRSCAADTHVRQFVNLHHSHRPRCPDLSD